MRTSIISICSLIASVAATTTMTAEAAPPPPTDQETVIIVLDQSGSMTLQGASDQAAGNTRWDDATNAAANWVEFHYGPTYDEGHFIAIWGFADGVEGPLWPEPTSGAGCPGTLKPLYAADGSTQRGFACQMPDDDEAGSYQDLAGSLRTGALHAMGPIDGAPMTNLADGMCDALVSLKGTETSQNTVIIQSDGDENWSVDFCSGRPSTVPADFALDFDNDYDWGFSEDGASTPEDGTWEGKALRAAARWNGTQPITTTVPPEYLSTDGVDQGAVFSGDFHWKVDLHYRTYSYETATLASVALARLAPAPVIEGGQNIGIPMAAFYSTAAATSTITYNSIPDAELAFFNILGTVSSQSVTTEYVAGDGTVYGTDHVFLADVDDSGCTDMADLNMVMQSDIWHRRAVEPNQLAIRADLNRDGWVNEIDREMILSPEHWGEVCQNPPTHPEGGASCWNRLNDGWETDVDCGGEDCLPCADGGMCEVDSDCESSPCIDGICGGPMTTCTEAVAIDLGAPGKPKVVPNDACLKVKNGLPWWWGVRRMGLQTQNGGTYPVPFNWTSSCTGGAGTGRFTADWQTAILDKTSKACATLIKLQGTGGNVKLVYYGY
ncbi:MAG: hypothetical protein JW751_30505 [Polyangiaceae bacterium]|nr:hypothetical protein [Polyangiaceae bacterium]